MKVSYESLRPFSPSLTMEMVTNHPESIIDGMYSIETTKAMVRESAGSCDVFVFSDLHGQTVGTTSVVYKGGRDIEYRIKRIPAFLCNIYVLESCRGQSHAHDMVAQVMQHMYDSSHGEIREAYLAVSKNNYSAIRAYEKMGFTYVCDKAFIRALRINVPYHVL